MRKNEKDKKNTNMFKQSSSVISKLSSIYIYYTSIYIYIHYTHVITSTKFLLKQMWRLTKAIAEMKCDTEQTMNL